MNIDEIHNYLMEHNGFSSMFAYDLAIELDGKSMDEVDEFTIPIPEVNLTGKPPDITQVNQVNHRLTSKVNHASVPEILNSFVGVKINTELKTKIKLQADELGLPVSTLIRDILTQYFK